MLVFLICMVYLLAGLIYALYFTIIGVQKLDKDAMESNWKFRLIIIPGVLLLWPLLIVKKISK